MDVEAGKVAVKDAVKVVAKDAVKAAAVADGEAEELSRKHISEPTRQAEISYAGCGSKKKNILHIWLALRTRCLM